MTVLRGWTSRSEIYLSFSSDTGYGLGTDLKGGALLLWDPGSVRVGVGYMGEDLVEDP